MGHIGYVLSIRMDVLLLDRSRTVESAFFLGWGHFIKCVDKITVARPSKLFYFSFAFYALDKQVLFRIKAVLRMV